MLYKEFEEKLARLGFRVEYGEFKQIFIYTISDVMVARIFDNYQYDLYLFDKLGWSTSVVREEFIKLALEYTSTPIEKRTREPKYNVVAFQARSGYLPNLITELAELYGRADDGKLYYAAVDGKTKNFQWTMKQIEKYGLEDYERIEVED